jgi:Fe-S-cluster-containing dehydrogenase component
MRAEALQPSPLGILMHPRFGLWHAYRGALLFDHEISIQAVPALNHICDLCSEKPCLNACPVAAFTDAGYAVERCRSHVRDEGTHCREAGCIARNACPHDAYRYPDHVQAFHMAAFI